MRLLIYLILGITTILPFASCKKNQTSPDRRLQRDLFVKSVEILNKNIDMIQQANDSISLDSIDRICENNLITLNFRFPPETDFHLTESENDTLINLIMRFNHIRDSLRSLLSNRVPMELDSIGHVHPEVYMK